MDGPATLTIRLGCDASEIPSNVDLVHLAEHAVSDEFGGARVRVQDGFVFVFDRPDHVVRYRLVIK